MSNPRTPTWRWALVGFLSAVPLSAQSYNATINQGRTLPVDEARQLEEFLGANPGDLDARARLIGYYSAHAAQDPFARAGRIRQVEWLVRNEPGSFLLRNPIARLQPPDFVFPNDTRLEPLRAAWSEQVEQHANDAVVVENAMLSMGVVELASGGTERVARYLQRLRVLEPGDPEWAQSLSGIYELAIVDAAIPNAGVAAKLTADGFVSALLKSEDAAVVGFAGATLYLDLQMKMVANPSASLPTLAELLLRRASMLNPENPGWKNLIGSPVPSNVIARADILTELLHPSDLWPGGVVSGIPMPVGAVRMSPEEEAAKRPRLVSDSPVPNLGTGCSAQFGVLIGVDGRIRSLQVTGFEHLNVPFVSAGRDALRRAQYPPVTLDGKPVEALAQIDVKCSTR